MVRRCCVPHTPHCSLPSVHCTVRQMAHTSMYPICVVSSYARSMMHAVWTVVVRWVLHRPRLPRHTRTLHLRTHRARTAMGLLPDQITCCTLMDGPAVPPRT